MAIRIDSDRVRRACSTSAFAPAAPCLALASSAASAASADSALAISYAASLDRCVAFSSCRPTTCVGSFTTAVREIHFTLISR